MGGLQENFGAALEQSHTWELPLSNTLLLVGTAAGHGLRAVMGLLWGFSSRMALGVLWAALGYTHGTSSLAPDKPLDLHFAPQDEGKMRVRGLFRLLTYSGPRATL